MSPRLVAALVFTGLMAAPGLARPALAQSEPVSTPLASAVASTASTAFAIDQTAAPVPREMRPQGPAWSTSLLIGLQAATVATQALDVHSTVTALNAGAVEANPIMGGLVKNRGAFIGVKAAIGAGLVYATHRVGQRNKVAAIAMAAAMNSAYLIVINHNYKVARALR